jgi:hypothetical protein
VDYRAFDFDFILLGGGLNLTLSLCEVWGSHPKQDSLGDIFLNHFFESHKMVDVEPSKLVPIWWNYRKNEESISKRLD